MKIGKVKLAVARPDNLNERLLASTGCSLEEMQTMLAGPCSCTTLAQALLPFTADISLPELASLIGSVGAENVAPAVKELYVQDPEPAGTGAD